MPDRSQFGTEVSKHTDRAYIVETPSGEYRRNRVQLNKLPPDTQDSHVPDTPPLNSHERQIPPSTPQPSTPTGYTHRPATGSTPKAMSVQPTGVVVKPSSPGVYVTRSGRSSHTPAKYDSYQMK